MHLIFKLTYRPKPSTSKFLRDNLMSCTGHHQSCNLKMNKKGRNIHRVFKLVETVSSTLTAQFPSLASCTPVLRTLPQTFKLVTKIFREKFSRFASGTFSMSGTPGFACKEIEVISRVKGTKSTSVCLMYSEFFEV